MHISILGHDFELALHNLPVSGMIGAVSAVLIVTVLIVMAMAAVLVAGGRRLRRSCQEALRLNDRLQRVIDGTRAGTWEWNVQTGEAVFNRHWAEMLGFTLEELQPVSVETWKRFCHPDDLALSNEALERHFWGEVGYDVEVRMRHRDGRWIWVHAHGRVCSWTEDGKPLWMFGTHMDTTRRREAIRERNELLQRFEELSGNVPGVLYQYCLRADGSAYFPYASPGLEDVYGCTFYDVKEDATPVFSVLHPGDAARVADSILRSARDLTIWHETYRVNHPKLGLRWVEGTATPSCHEDGSVTWHGYVRDITELHEIRERNRLAASVFEASQEGIMITDAERRIIDVNPAFTDITGYTREEAIGQSPSILHSGRQGWDFYRALYRKLRQDGSWQGEIWNRRKSGEIFPELLSISAVTNERGELQHYVAIFTDISAIKAHEKKLDRIAHYDALTEIPNRRLLGDRLRQAVAHARRHGQPLAVCMMDLDNFKPVNDQYGHEAGDRLLVEIAHRLKSLLREEDTVARLGGDEFVLLFRNPEGCEVFERVLGAVRQPIHLAEGTVVVSASLGVAYLDLQAPCDGDQLLRQADQALYQSKETGRNRFTIYRP